MFIPMYFVQPLSIMHSLTVITVRDMTLNRLSDLPGNSISIEHSGCRTSSFGALTAYQICGLYFIKPKIVVHQLTRACLTIGAPLQQPAKLETLSLSLSISTHNNS